jgi:hypothetical protein
LIFLRLETIESRELAPAASVMWLFPKDCIQESWRLPVS